jgi:hypothetical protein
MYFLDGAVGPVNAALLGAIPGVVLSVLVWGHRESLVDPSPQGTCEAGRRTLAVGVVHAADDPALPGLLRPRRRQHRRHPAVRRAGLRIDVRRVAELCGVLPDRVHLRLGRRHAAWAATLPTAWRHHERVAAIGLLVAAAFTLPIATLALPPVLLPILLFGAGFAGGTTNPSRDMIVRQVTPPVPRARSSGSSISGLDIGSFLAPLVFGQAMNAGHAATMFWITIGLYLFNATLVMVIRQTTSPRAVPAAAE